MPDILSLLHQSKIKDAPEDIEDVVGHSSGPASGNVGQFNMLPGPLTSAPKAGSHQYTTSSSSGAPMQLLHLYIAGNDDHTV